MGVHPWNKSRTVAGLPVCSAKAVLALEQMPDLLYFSWLRYRYELGARVGFLPLAVIWHRWFKQHRLAFMALKWMSLDVRKGMGGSAMLSKGSHPNPWEKSRLRYLMW